MLSLDEELWWLQTFIECETRARGSEGYTPSELEMRMTGRAAGCHVTTHQKRDADDGGIAYTHCNETRTKCGDGSHSTRPSDARREQWVEVVAVPAHAYRTQDANDRQRGYPAPIEHGTQTTDEGGGHHSTTASIARHERMRWPVHPSNASNERWGWCLAQHT